MKIIKIFLLVLILIYLLSSKLVAQDLKVHSMIGRKISEVIKQYGNPIHQDKSNPEMICMFYKGDNGTATFVGNNAGIYQAEAFRSFGSETDARSAIDNFISKSIADGFVCDTVSRNDFQLSKTGIKATLQLNNNKITKRTDVNVKARKSET